MTSPLVEGTEKGLLLLQDADGSAAPLAVWPPYPLASGETLFGALVLELRAGSDDADWDLDTMLAFSGNQV